MACRIDVVRLQPAQVKDSVVRHPVPHRAVEKMTQLLPVLPLQLKAVDQNNCVCSNGAKLKQAHLAAFGLQLERLRVEVNGG